MLIILLSIKPSYGELNLQGLMRFATMPSTGANTHYALLAKDESKNFTPFSLLAFDEKLHTLWQTELPSSTNIQLFAEPVGNHMFVLTNTSPKSNKDFSLFSLNPQGKVLSSKVYDLAPMLKAYGAEVFSLFTTRNTFLWH